MKDRLKRFWRRYRGIVGWAAVILWELCTLPVWQQAHQFREHPGIGGEIFWPFMPMFFYWAAETIYGIWQVAKEDGSDAR